MGYTLRQVYELALPIFGAKAAVAASVSHAENSTGNPGALGDVALANAKWGPSVGLWQIRSLHADKGTGRTRDEIANRNPQTNARHAYVISKGGTDWSPWSVYGGKAQRDAFMEIATADWGPAEGVGAGDAAGAVGGIVTNPSQIPDVAGQVIDQAGRVFSNPLEAIAALISTLMDPAWWRRIGVGVLGVGLLIVAAVILGRELLTDTLAAK